MDITKMLTASTGHVTKAEAQAFDSDTPPVDVTVWRSDRGWMFYVGADEDSAPLLATKGLSEGLRGAIIVARAERCDFLRLDADYDAIPGVAYYHWD